MNAVTIFLLGLVLTMGVVFAALLYLRTPLQVILTDLCGNTDRAHFWTAFSNVTLFLVPFVLALDHRAEGNEGQATIFAISGQMEYAIIGLVISVVVLGFILSWYINRITPVRVAEGNPRR